MASESIECPGSWRPIPHLEPGDGVVCDSCKRQVSMRPAPLDLNSGPWPGEKHARVEPHPAAAAVARSAIDVPWSEG
jgi:hypothetical protein